MSKEVMRAMVGFEDQVEFKFYTYDKTGRDIVIPVFAEDEDSAWVKFDRVYGTETEVDMVLRCK